jgi:hypothetical protein
MKECPTCKRVYADDTLNFCLSDGSVLTIIPEPAEATLVLPKLIRSKESTTTRKGVSPVFAYLSIGLLALFVGGALVAWYKVQPSAANEPTQTNKPVQTAPSNQAPLPTANLGTTAPSPRDDSKSEADVRAALDGWVQSLVEHDLERHLSYYADRLGRYRGKTNTDITEVRKYNDVLFSKYVDFRLRIQNVRIVPSTDGQVTTTYESVYDFRGSKPHTGVDRHTEMRWKQVNGGWKIVSES